METIKNTIINIIHLFVGLAALIVPFTSPNVYLLLYIITVPFVMLHWIIQDNTCAITKMEKFIRQKIFNSKKCITCEIIEPIYDFPKNNKYNGLAYIILISLLIFVIIKLLLRYSNGKIKTFGDLLS